MAITDSIKSILSVKTKPRHDTYSDHYSRIFMVKVMMVATLLTGMSWYSDKINCVIPQTIGANGGFVSSACWINGFYVYEQIRYHADEVGYFGVPREIDHDGVLPDGQLCDTKDKALINNPRVKCEPMEKTFFLQYQYMTFVMAALALLYYAPYSVYRLISQDMVSLKGSVGGNDAASIVRSYFNHRTNSLTKMRLRVLGILVVKMIYIAVNVVAFLILDSILNNGFISYGIMWNTWTKLDNSLAYDYMGVRHSPKPGNALLPTFGLCEVHESARDIKTGVINKYKFVCEFSQHVLYQYVLIVVWYAMVVGIVVSIIGLLMKVVEYFVIITCTQRGDGLTRRMLRELTLREQEYLEFIRQKNVPLYNDVMNKLKEDFGEGHANKNGYY